MADKKAIIVADDQTGMAVKYKDVGGGLYAEAAQLVDAGGGDPVGATTDAAVTTDTTSSLSGKLRGLVKILGDVWDITNHVFNVNLKTALLPSIDGVRTDSDKATYTAGCVALAPSGAGVLFQLQGSANKSVRLQRLRITLAYTGGAMQTLALYLARTAAGVAPTQTLTVTGGPTGGTVVFSYNGSNGTGTVAYNDTAANVQTHLRGIAALAAVTVAGANGGPWTVTLTGVSQPILLVLQTNSLTGGAGPSVTIAGVGYLAGTTPAAPQASAHKASDAAASAVPAFFSTVAVAAAASGYLKFEEWSMVTTSYLALEWVPAPNSRAWQLDGVGDYLALTLSGIGTGTGIKMALEAVWTEE